MRNLEDLLMNRWENSYQETVGKLICEILGSVNLMLTELDIQHNLSFRFSVEASIEEVQEVLNRLVEEEKVAGFIQLNNEIHYCLRK